jgi:hypothetical protein
MFRGNAWIWFKRDTHRWDSEIQNTYDKENILVTYDNLIENK